eukprot:comp6575_c0_seq1/m.2351 comp6575_c0_seq1/g.2351  ORF comp6575_c0_seq1/g.2351 comp6575_c0_seq1/m.2351 type:complete len:403 (-) comp6575_c0_seq1:289-1497(-)
MVVTRASSGSLPKRAAVVAGAVISVVAKRTAGTKRVKTEKSEQDGVKKAPKKTKVSIAKEEHKVEVKEDVKEKSAKKRRKEVKVEVEEVKVEEEGAGKKKRAAAKKSKIEAVTATGPPTVYNRFVGAHVSAAGGPANAVTNAVAIGANAFALDLRSKRRWESPPLKEDAAAAFKETLKAHNILPDHVVPHGSYLINAGSADPELLDKSRAALVDEVSRCEMLGLTLYNFHPGSTCGLIDNEECIKNIGDSINHVHAHTKGVTVLVEAMAGQGSTVGGKFAHLRDIISHVKDKTRVGVCLDSCHIFAAGYDIRTKEAYEAVMTEFDQTVGMKYLKAWHINDSKTPLGGLKDRHENLGKGFIGLETFRLIMNDLRMARVPLILETPECDYSIEINLLRSMVVNK